MADLETEARPAIDRLLLSNPDQLYAQLGLRRRAIEADPTQAGLFDVTATFDAEFAGPLGVLKDFGQSFFNNVNQDVYELVCGSGTGNAAQRNKLLNAIGGGPAAFAAALAAALVSTFGWAPALAAVVAALVVKLFFKNAYLATCQVWQKHLPPSKGRAPAPGKPAASAPKKRQSAGGGRAKKKK